MLPILPLTKRNLSELWLKLSDTQNLKGLRRFPTRALNKSSFLFPNKIIWILQSLLTVFYYSFLTAAPTVVVFRASPNFIVHTSPAPIIFKLSSVIKRLCLVSLQRWALLPEGYKPKEDTSCNIWITEWETCWFPDRSIHSYSSAYAFKLLSTYGAKRNSRGQRVMCAETKISKIKTSVLRTLILLLLKHEKRSQGFLPWKWICGEIISKSWKIWQEIFLVSSCSQGVC